MALKVSVIVPAYNAGGEIGGCLDSLLSVDYPKGDYEVIVVDNNSDDSTAEVVKRYPVAYVFEGKRGSYNARNAGVRISSGEFIAFTDADCIVDVSWFRRLLEGFQDPEVGVVGGSIRAYKPKTLVERYSAVRALPQDDFASRRMPFAATANAAFRRSVLEEAGLFDGSFSSGGDEEVCWRIKKKGYKIAYKPDAVVYHRHRKTAGELFSLYARYGRGQAMLYKKYGLRQIDVGGYLSIIVNILLKTPLRILNSPWSSDKALHVATPVLDALAEAGFKAGCWEGSLKHKVVFV
ncbi:MAG: glycosyltransferase [Candidatus Altiarchaeota archaeon]|nr:glycosyltransferase [Candidatus Altiarchaeota archaeon]